MQNDRSFDIVQNSNSPPQPQPPVVANEPNPIEQYVLKSLQPTTTVVSRPNTRRIPWWVFAIGAGLILLVGIIIFVAVTQRSSQFAAGNFKTTDLPLSAAEADEFGASDIGRTLKVNGELQVSNSLILTPGTEPTSAVAGQMYYDQTSNQLLYFNGQQFTPVGGTTITNNFLTGTGTGVQLQGTSPGTQQTGNFNVSGTGRVGTLSTTVISSSGGTLYFNPASSANQQSVAAGTPATVGLINGALVSGTGWANDLVATKITMGAVGGTSTSIGVAFGGGTAGDHVQVAVYDDDGDIPSKPGNLIAASASVNLVPNGITTVTIPTTLLSGNTSYWLAVNTDSTTVTRSYNGGSRATCFVSRIFGFMPDPFSTGGCFYDDNQYAIYINYITGGGASGSISQAQFSLSTNGQALFRNTEDATNGFQIQNASGLSTIFNVDTINSRIAIGKSNAGYKLDIAGGDINLSNGRSLRFGGSPALSSSGSGGTTILSNFTSGGTVSVQSANFVVQDADGAHTHIDVDNSTGAAIFQNSTDSAAGFAVQNAAGVSLFTVDTTGLSVRIGSSSGSGTPVVLYLANKNTAGDPAGAEGGTYYNSTLASFRCYYNGAWHNCADIEPQHGFSLYDDFMGGGTSFTGQIGSLGWNAAAIGANGSLAMNPATPTPSINRPGVLQLQTPAVANQGTTLLLGNSGAASMLVAKDNNVKVAVAAGAATGQVMRVGLHDETTATTQPLSGVWWEANPAVNANWRYCHGDGAAATCTNTSVAIAANTWVTLEIRVTATGSGTSAATFVINNTPFTVSAVTIDSTNRVSPALTCYGTTGSAQNCYIDYFQLTGTTTAAR